MLLISSVVQYMNLLSVFRAFGDEGVVCDTL